MNKFSQFWNAFKEAWKVTFVEEADDVKTQTAKEIERFNVLVAMSTAIKYLTTTGATFKLETDSTQASELVTITGLLQDYKDKNIENLLHTGESFLFPAKTKMDTWYGWIINRDALKIIEMQGDEIYEAYAVVEQSKDKKYNLLRHHLLTTNGDLTVSYFSVKADTTKPAYCDEFEGIDGVQTIYRGANHIGFARYKSPVSSRGLSVLGVPLNFGCGEIEKDIFQCLEDIREEFKLTKPKIFADRSILVKKQYDDRGREVNKYDMPDGMFAIEKRAGVDGKLIDYFSMPIQYSTHYQRLINLFEQMEKQVGVSKGILSPAEPTSTATATEINRSNDDTKALISNLHDVLDKGNIEALKAYNLSLNVPDDLWSYSSDYLNPFESELDTFAQLKDGVSLGALEVEDLTRWLMPSLTEEEIEEKMKRISEKSSINADTALMSALRY